MNNALPALKERADLVTDGDDGRGVSELSQPAGSADERREQREKLSLIARQLCRVVRLRVAILQ